MRSGSGVLPLTSVQSQSCAWRLVVPMLALTCLLWAGAAGAEADSEYVREGGYIAAAGVFALENTSQEYSDLDNTGGVQARFGYRLAPQLGFELFGEWLGYQGENPGAFGVNMKLYPVEFFDTSLLGGVVQPYVMGSAGFIWVDKGGTNVGGNFRGGGGLDVYLSEHVFLFGEVHYSGAGGVPSGIESTNFLAGGGWRF